MWVLGAILGPQNKTPTKQEPFECGVTAFAAPGDHFGVKFYLIAILFVVFDIDLAFFFPWAVVFREIGSAALYSMIVFVGLLAMALWYVWRKGAFRWE